MNRPLPSFLSPITTPASWVYGAIIAARNRRFDRGVGIEAIDRPVISIGNITTGGTGKTPMVAWIAEQLLTAGHRPMIAMRGYKSVKGGLSDEQAEYAARLPDVHVIANPDRISELRAFLPLHPEIDCVLLDDGFQHRQLKRDLDLVLIDATADTFNDRLLPAGNLREPLPNLRRADAVIVTHARSVVGLLKLQQADKLLENFDPNDLENLKGFNRRLSEITSSVADIRDENTVLKSQVERHHGRLPVALCRHVWTGLDVYEDKGRRLHTTDWLRGKRVLTMLGIGNPNSVIDQLQSCQATVAVNIPCSDHESYDTAKVAVARGLCTGCQAMITTAKDWVKLRKLIELSSWPAPIVVPQLRIEVVEGADRLRELVLSKLAAPTAGKPAR